MLKEVHRALYRRLPSVKGILPPSEAEAWDSLALDESSSDEDEGPVEREGPDSYFCVVFAGGREAHEGFVVSLSALCVK